MKDNKLWVGIFVVVAIVLFGVALFLIGNQHKAFRRHVEYYAEFTNLDGIAEGAKVRVSGMDGGQVSKVIIPSSPAQKFRLKLTVDERLHGLIRNDSVVSVETAGLVGDEFVLIKSGSDRAPEAAQSATLPSKEPFDLTKMLDQANGLLKQVGGTISDVQGKLDVALNSVTNTVDNTNGVVTDIHGVVTDIRRGKGTAGLLLEDKKSATDVQQTLVNVRQASVSLDAASAQVNTMLQDVQQRQLVAKVDDTLNSAKGATQQVNEASQQINAALKTALAQDQYGQDAGTNLQQTLSNVNVATGNLADDTAALKQEFFFKGFFKKRGYDNLDQLPVGSYRSGELFKSLSQNRQWIPAGELFTENADGSETLSAAGRTAIEDAVSQMPELYNRPIVVEGYAPSTTSARELVVSRQRAVIVRGYLQIHFHLEPKQTGIIGLSTAPPTAAGKTTWDGICLTQLIGKQ